MGYVAGGTGTIFVEVFHDGWLCGELEAANIYYGSHWGVFRESTMTWDSFHLSGQ